MNRPRAVAAVDAIIGYAERQLRDDPRCVAVLDQVHSARDEYAAGGGRASTKRLSAALDLLGPLIARRERELGIGR